MAETYKVCVNGVSTNATINIVQGSCPSQWINYTYGDCEIFEKYKSLYFTSNIASESNYNIYYTWTVTYYENYQETGTQVMNSYVTMLAGQTHTTTIQVMCDYYAWCNTGTNPTEREYLPSEV